MALAIYEPISKEIKNMSVSCFVSKNHTTSALDIRCWNFSKFPLKNFTKPMENSEPNLDEQESILLIDYSSCSSLFNRVNQAHIGCNILLHINNKGRK